MNKTFNSDEFNPILLFNRIIVSLNKDDKLLVNEAENYYEVIRHNKGEKTKLDNKDIEQLYNRICTMGEISYWAETQKGIIKVRAASHEITVDVISNKNSDGRLLEVVINDKKQITQA